MHKQYGKMNVYIEDESLRELLEYGCTSDKKYKKLTKDVINGFRKTFRYLSTASRIEDLYRIKSLNYERLSGKLKEFESVRCTGRWRLIFQSYSSGDSLIITEIKLIELSNHYED